jgi:hypothetical protein
MFRGRLVIVLAIALLAGTTSFALAELMRAHAPAPVELIDIDVEAGFDRADEARESVERRRAARRRAHAERRAQARHVGPPPVPVAPAPAPAPVAPPPAGGGDDDGGDDDWDDDRDDDGDDD